MTDTNMSRSPVRWILILFACIVPLAGCGSGGNNDQHPKTASFAVMSDTHLYDGATLGTTGAEFASTTLQENKLLAESGEILSSAITAISSSGVDFVLVTGDLTKDGERINHEMMASRLAGLKAGGKKVFVIPGNHDINNPNALSYTTSPPTKVATVSPAEFERIYADYGYRDALYRDSASLSYIAEPVPGIWLLALDSCIYTDNLSQGTATTSGTLDATTRAWVINRLNDAKAKGKVVIGMMHHGVLEHLTNQSLVYPEYLLNNWQEVSAEFASHGLRIMFTGHFHSHDATMRDFNGSQLYDIETGSLVSFPNAYRTATYDFDAGQLSIQTEKITVIPSHPADFATYARAASTGNLNVITRQMLSLSPYNLTEPNLTSVSNLLVAGLMAHFEGNESPSIITMLAYQALVDNSDTATHQLGLTLESLWTDLAPADNALTIALGK